MVDDAGVVASTSCRRDRVQAFGNEVSVIGVASLSTTEAQNMWSQAQAGRHDRLDRRSVPAHPIARSDEVVLSAKAQGAPREEGASTEALAAKAAPAKTDTTGEKLSEAQHEQVEELKARDIEVRAHENAHAAVGGAYAGSPQYDYQAGPDGQRYAVGGHVQIDVSEIDGDPAATIQKMQTVRAAALAPADPSAADRAVAARASQKEAEAVQELAAHQQAASQTANDRTRVAAAPAQVQQNGQPLQVDSLLAQAPEANSISYRRALAAYGRSAYVVDPSR